MHVRKTATKACVKCTTSFQCLQDKSQSIITAIKSQVQAVKSKIRSQGESPVEDNESRVKKLKVLNQETSLVNGNKKHCRSPVETNRSHLMTNKS